MLERAALSRQTTRGSVTLSGTREQVGVERDGIAPVVGRIVFLVVSSTPLNSKSLIAKKKKGNVPEDDISL